MEIGSRSERPSCRQSTRSVSTVVGVVLMLGVVILLAVAIGTLTSGVTEELGGPSPLDAQINLESSERGTTAFVRSVRSPVEIWVNGVPVYTVDNSDVGREIFIPTAPGDEIEIYSKEDQQTLILRETVDPASGNLIAYYRYDSGSGSTLEDHSENDNDGNLSAGGASTQPTWGKSDNGTYLEFDGSDDYVEVDDMTVTSTDSVDEFTYAVRFKIDSTASSEQNLAEHESPTTANEWFLETEDGSPPFKMSYAVDGTGNTDIDGPETTRTEQVHVAVGTYNSDTGEYRLYLNGTELNSGTHTRETEVGDMIIGADSNPSDQNFNGRMYESRFYYEEFSQFEVELLSRLMRGQAAE